MRILHVSQPTGYGVAMALRTLTSSQVAAGHDVTVLGASSTFNLALDRRARLVDWTRSKPLDPRLPIDIGVIRRAVRAGAADGQPFDVVHLHSSRAGVAGRAVGLGLPVVFQPHGWSFHPLQGRRRELVAGMERRMATRSTGLIYCSSAERRLGLAVGIEPPRHVVAHNAPSVERLVAPGPVPDRSAAREALNLPLDAPIFAFVGRLAPAKAPDRLWQAWSAVRRRDAWAQLLVMGDGYVPPLAGIRHLGFVHDVGSHLDACDAMMLLSRWEGMPLAVLDAMARGVPVVASREAIDPEDLAGAGVVVNGDVPGEVADALLARRAGTVQWVREATAGLDLTAGRYAPDRVAQRVCDFYHELVAA
ncbi:MAG: glycosyltransferase family 4 protein [Acidimicrobiia bacterium]|nr:glycosyltransferase family 4 protein [Acidimicrobiia bacterium]